MIRAFSVLALFAAVAAPISASAGECPQFERVYDRCIRMENNEWGALGYRLEREGDAFTVSSLNRGGDLLLFRLEANGVQRKLQQPSDWESLSCEGDALVYRKFEKAVFFPGDPPAPDHEVTQAYSLRNGALYRTVADNHASLKFSEELCFPLR